MPDGVLRRFEQPAGSLPGRMLSTCSAGVTPTWVLNTRLNWRSDRFSRRARAETDRSSLTTGLWLTGCRDAATHKCSHDARHEEVILNGEDHVGL